MFSSLSIFYCTAVLFLPLWWIKVNIKLGHFYFYRNGNFILGQQQQQSFYSPLSGTTRVSRYQKKHSPTHPPSWSSSNLYQFLPSTTIHSILPVQITCLAIFLHNLFPCPLWSTSWSGALHLIFHTFLHPVSVFFSQHMPIPSQPVWLYIRTIGLKLLTATKTVYYN